MPHPTDCNACIAITIPAPASRSTPGASLSIAVLIRAVRICAGVSPGESCFSNAVIAAACGAAADVPKNEPNPGTEVATPSAAVISGF